MSVIIFIIILSALIIVHELGHFLAAKKFGIRVDEFGLGFPPRAKKLFTWRDTPFTLNWLPFGGFVKIFGESPSETSTNEKTEPESFVSKNRSIQALVLVAGVLGNFVFAWALLSFGFMVGLPASTSGSLPVEESHVVVTTVLPSSPASLAGLKSGDTIVSLSRDGLYSDLSPKALSDFIAQSPDSLTFEIERSGVISNKVVVPQEGLIGDRPAIGISMDAIGIVELSPHKALWHGLKSASSLTLLTAEAFGSFIGEAFVGRADLSGLTGPVGIVGMVSDLRELGFAYLLTFTALISINLAVINLLPFPALDGGRLLFVCIEALVRRPIPTRLFNVVNAIGFALLIILMLLITVQDIRNIL